VVGLQCFVGTLPQANYCDTDFGLQSFRLYGNNNCTIFELAADFGLRSHNRTIANLRKILDCVTTTELLQTCERFWVARTTTSLLLRAVEAKFRQNFYAAKPPNRRDFATALEATYLQ